MQRTTSSAIVLISLLAVVPLQGRSQKQSTNLTDVKAVRQIEVDLGTLAIAGQFGKLSQLYADDFAGVDSSGKTYTRKDVISGEETNRLLWFETGPIDVQVFGNIALGQGVVNEKRLRNGKETTPRLAWMDILLKSAGKWHVVRSADSRVDLAEWPIAHQDLALIRSIKKIQQDVGNAMVAVDINKLSQSYADDWADLGLSDAEVLTKDNLLSDFKSGEHKLASFKFGPGPMNVQVIGNVAIVQTGVTESRIQDGKDISGQFAFMDLLKKREGKWVIVRTLSARVS